MFGSLVRRICGVAMCANTVSAMRSSVQLSESPSSRRKSIDRCQRVAAGHALSRRSSLEFVRATADTSFTCIEADPSCSTTMSRPARLMTVVTPRGRASATAKQAAERIRNNQNHRSPPIANRSRYGTDRRARNRRRSTSRRQKRHTHNTSNAAGAARSHSNCGAPKAMLLTPCARAWRPVWLRAAPHDHRIPSA